MNEFNTLIVGENQRHSIFWSINSGQLSGKAIHLPFNDLGRWANDDEGKEDEKAANSRTPARRLVPDH
jgi:hypothetical protein